jgi:hypothetical protein
VKASMQIGDLQLCLQEDVREANTEAGEVSHTARNLLRTLFGGPTEGGAGSNSTILAVRRVLPNEQVTSKDVSNSNDARFPSERGDRSRYSIPTTIYFHLLTSPIGSSVRAFGDAAAWISTIVARRGRVFLSWVRRRSNK